METSRKKSLAAKYGPLLAILMVFLCFNIYAQYNPSVAGTTSNKPYAPNAAAPTDSRSYFYDQVNFVWRPYQSTSEVLFYLNLAKYRTGQFDIVVNSGGTIGGGGLLTGGTNTIYYFKNGTADSNLVVKVAPVVDPSLFLLKANNLSDLQSISTAKTNLNLNLVDNTSDATKNSATVTLTNKTISGSNNNITNLPNSALNNSTIGITLGTSGTDFGVTGTPVSLGSSVTFNFPTAAAGVTGKLSSTDWNTFNNKQNAITLTTSGSSGAATFVGGVLNIPQYSGGGGGTGNADSIRHLFVDTGSIAHNLYTLAFDSTNRKWVLTPPGTGGGGGVTNFSFSNANGFTGVVTNASTIPNLTLGTSITGLLFGNGTALGAATVSSPLTYSSGTLGIQTASGSQAGALSATDWTTFNGKQGAITLTTTGTSGAATFIGNTLNIPNYATGGGSGTVTSFSAGTLSPLFTTSVATATTTPALTFNLSTAAANSVFGNNTGSTAAPAYFVPNATTLNGWFGGTIQGAISLTTTGTSGASTLIGNTLNIPQYSGGGSQTFPQVLATGRTFSANDSAILGNNYFYFSGGLLKGDSMRVGPVVYENTINDTIVYFGTSITFGTGPTSNYYRYSTVATRQLVGYGFLEYNLGVSGATIASRLGSVPTKTTGMRFLVFEFGTNEINTAIDSATFRTNYNSLMSEALSKGWSASQIIILSQMGSQVGAFGTLATMRGFNYVDSTICIQYGAAYADCFNPELIKEYNYITATPNMHPNNDQSYILAAIVAGSVTSTYNSNHQKLSVKDTAQLSSLIYKNNYFINKGQMLGVDSFGHVGVIKTLHNNFATQGNFIINNNLQFRGAVIPSVFDSTKDILMNTNQKVVQSATTNGLVYATITPINNAGISTWLNNFATGEIDLTTTTVKASTDIVIGRNLGFTNAGFGIISKTQGISTNQYQLSEGGTAHMTWRNQFTTGNDIWYMSNGTSGTDVQMLTMFPSGRIFSQNGGTHTDLPQSRLTINSTTEGFLMPRMNVGQRNAIAVGQISSGSVTGTGSGYTTGTYTSVSLTGGSGSGVVANVNISSGQVSSVVITNAGVNYRVGDILSATSASIGGTGSGFQYTISAVLTNGLMIFNITTNKPNWYDGAAGLWRVPLDSLGGGGSGVTTVGTFSASSIANGASIASTTITFGPADGTNPGMIKATGSQTLGVTLTMPAPIFTGMTSAGANDSVLTMNPATGQTRWRTGTFALNVANGLTAPTTDSIKLGGTLNQTTTIATAGFNLSLTGTGSFILSGSGGSKAIMNGNMTGFVPASNTGAALTISSFTTNDATSSGTVVGFASTEAIAATTFTATSSTTYTNAATLYVAAPVAGSNVTFSAINPPYGIFTTGNVGALHYFSNTSNISTAAGAGAGTGPTLSSSGTDLDGTITVTTGTVPSAASGVVTATYATAFPNNSYVTITPGNAVTAALSGISMVYATSTTTGFTINSGTTALAAATTYVWFYHAGGK